MYIQQLHVYTSGREAVILIGQNVDIDSNVFSAGFFVMAQVQKPWILPLLMLAINGFKKNFNPSLRRHLFITDKWMWLLTERYRLSTDCLLKGQNLYSSPATQRSNVGRVRSSRQNFRLTKS